VSTAPPPLLPSSGLGPLALRMLAKKPEDRPASAEAVIEEIDAARFFAPVRAAHAVGTAREGLGAGQDPRKRPSRSRSPARSR